MNICFLFGEINSDIKFEFLLNNKKYISIASCFILSQNKIIKICAYDELADILYSKYEKGCLLLIEGNITNDYVEVNKIYEY